MIESEAHSIPAFRQPSLANHKSLTRFFVNAYSDFAVRRTHTHTHTHTPKKGREKKKEGTKGKESRSPRAANDSKHSDTSWKTGKWLKLSSSPIPISCGKNNGDGNRFSDTDCGQVGDTVRPPNNKIKNKIKKIAHARPVNMAAVRRLSLSVSFSSRNALF